jgi:autotransporter-associated beta strand protein
VLSNGTLTANGGNFNVSAGTITAVLAGSNGLVKSGNGTVALSAANSFSGSTSIQSGTLRADSANALGGTSNVVINNGGSFLVTADDAIGTNTGIELNGGTMAFGAAGYDGYVGALTLSANSILDLGTSSNGVLIRFNSINWSNANALLSIYNWTGTTQWQGGTGNNTDQVYFTNSTLSDTELQRISFFSDTGSSFVGNAFQITSGTYNREIIAVPEPQTWVSAVLLLLAGFWWTWRKRQTDREHKAPDKCRNLVA